MYPNPFTYHRPTSVEDAVSLLAEHGDDAAPYAGGTELLLAMKMGFARYDHLVDLKRLPELRTIERVGESLKLGALATHAEIAANVLVGETLPALATLCRAIANPRVRSCGTIGGNLCFAEPRADPPALLAALDATLVLRGPTGERGVPAGAFITGALDTIREPDELLLRVEIPLTARAVRYERIVFGHRTVAGAAAVIGDAPRIWIGCVASRPAALERTEALLADDPRTPSEQALREAVARDLAALDVADDEEAGADYRRHLAFTVALRAIAAAREGQR